jgi:hypothetical protein
MEHTKVEIEAVKNTVAEATNLRLRELNDLQLTLVGGGFAEVTFI